MHSDQLYPAYSFDQLYQLAALVSSDQLADLISMQLRSTVMQPQPSFARMLQPNNPDSYSQHCVSRLFLKITLCTCVGLQLLFRCFCLRVLVLICLHTMRPEVVPRHLKGIAEVHLLFHERSVLIVLVRRPIPEE